MRAIDLGRIARVVGRVEVVAGEIQMYSCGHDGQT